MTPQLLAYVIVPGLAVATALIGYAIAFATRRPKDKKMSSVSVTATAHFEERLYRGAAE